MGWLLRTDGVSCEVTLREGDRVIDTTRVSTAALAIHIGDVWKQNRSGRS